MDTFTEFTRTASHLPVHILLWGFLFLSTVAIIYWAATINNDIENNPDKDK